MDLDEAALTTASAGLELAHVQGLEAVATARPPAVAASVTHVAKELGLDLSGASRMVSAAVAAGYVQKASAPDDARRSELALTPKGRVLLARARQWQEETFRRLVADWSSGDAKRFASYLDRLSKHMFVPDEE